MLGWVPCWSLMTWCAVFWKQIQWQEMLSLAHAVTFGGLPSVCWTVLLTNVTKFHTTHFWLLVQKARKEQCSLGGQSVKLWRVHIQNLGSPNTGGDVARRIGWPKWTWNYCNDLHSSKSKPSIFRAVCFPLVTSQQSVWLSISKTFSTWLVPLVPAPTRPDDAGSDEEVTLHGGDWRL